jgi:general secretion pathway protein F
MADFRYEALDIEGKPRGGLISAPSSEAARADLLEQPSARLAAGAIVRRKMRAEELRVEFDALRRE